MYEDDKYEYDKEELQAKLAATMLELDELNEADVTTNETSIRNCGLMVQYWRLKIQLAELEHAHHGDNPVVAKAWREEIRSASRQCSDWEQRKNAAWEKRKLDELPKILAKIEELGQAKSLLGSLS